MTETTSEQVQTFDSPFADPPAPTVWPAVGFADVDAGMRLLAAFGFAVTMIVRDDAGAVVHAEARWPDGGGVMFGSRGKAGHELGAQSAYVVAAEAATVDAAYARVRALPGVTVTVALSDTEYGSHQFGVRDADGNQWTVGTYRGTT